jgi:hypothetical protein
MTSGWDMVVRKFKLREDDKSFFASLKEMMETSSG